MTTVVGELVEQDLGTDPFHTKDLISDVFLHYVLYDKGDAREFFESRELMSEFISEAFDEQPSEIQTKIETANIASFIFRSKWASQELLQVIGKTQFKNFERSWDKILHIARSVIQFLSSESHRSMPNRMNGIAFPIEYAETSNPNSQYESLDLPNLIPSSQSCNRYSQSFEDLLPFCRVSDKNIVLSIIQESRASGWELFHIHRDRFNELEDFQEAKNTVYDKYAAVDDIEETDSEEETNSKGLRPGEYIQRVPIFIQQRFWKKLAGFYWWNVEGEWRLYFGLGSSRFRVFWLEDVRRVVGMLTGNETGQLMMEGTTLPRSGCMDKLHGIVSNVHSDALA